MQLSHSREDQVPASKLGSMHAHPFRCHSAGFDGDFIGKKMLVATNGRGRISNCILAPYNSINIFNTDILHVWSSPDAVAVC